MTKKRQVQGHHWRTWLIPDNIITAMEAYYSQTHIPKNHQAVMALKEYFQLNEPTNPQA